MLTDFKDLPLVITRAFKPDQEGNGNKNVEQNRNSAH
jgi:hypothetical protein